MTGCAVSLRADTFHKPGFKMHARILHHLFHIINTDVIKAPLWDVGRARPGRLPQQRRLRAPARLAAAHHLLPQPAPQQVEVRTAPAAPGALPTAALSALGRLCCSDASWVTSCADAYHDSLKHKTAGSKSGVRKHPRRVCAMLCPPWADLDVAHSTSIHAVPDGWRLCRREDWPDYAHRCTSCSFSNT